MDSIRTLLTGQHRILPAQPSSQAGPEKQVKLPAECICTSVGGIRMGWVYASEYEDGTPIEERDRNYGKAWPCVCSQQEVKANLRTNLLKWANLPEERTLLTEYRTETQAQRDAVTTVQQWVGGNIPEPWLFLYGSVGTGKTHLATAAAHMLLGAGIRVRYEYVPEFLRKLRDSYSRDQETERQGERGAGTAELWDYAQSADVLILDDLGTERATDWAAEQLRMLVDYRYREKAPTIITTNVGPEQIEPRIMSRLKDTWVCRPIAMIWADYRERKGVRSG